MDLMCLYQTVHHLVSNISLVVREAIMVILEENKFAFSDFHTQYYCFGFFFTHIDQRNVCWLLWLFYLIMGKD